MKRNIVASSILIALLAIASLYCRADMPRPSYNYHALSPLGFYTKLWMDMTEKEFYELLPWLFLGLFFVCLTIVVFAFLRKRRPRAAKVVLVCMCIIFITFAYGVCALGWRAYKDDHATAAQILYERTYDVEVSPVKGESYKEYCKRVYRIKNNLCLKCGGGTYEIYGPPRRRVCSKCDGGRLRVKKIPDSLEDSSEDSKMF